MEPHSKSKKRKPEDNGAPPSLLTKDDVLRMIEPLSRDQLADIVASAALHPGPVLSSVRSLCGRDLSQRKLFVRGLGWETTHETLKSVFSAYGELDEAVVISDKATGKSKGYGFVTFRHLDGAILALKDPSKKIDGRIAVTQLASSGGSGSASGPGSNRDSAQKNSAEVAPRKIFVGNVPSDMSSDRLLSEFSTFGEIQEGPVGIDKQTGKFKGFALFVYKTPQGAQAALANPNKLLDGHWLVCKPGGEGKKGKTGTGNNMAEPGPGGPMQGSEIANNALSFPAQYAGTGTVLPSYNGTGTGVLSYPAGFNLPNNSMNNPNLNPNPNPNPNPNNNNNGVGSYGPGSQYPGLAGLNFGNLGNSNPGLFRMNQATGFADPGQYPNQTQPGFSQPGLGQAGMGQVGLGQPVIGQQSLSQPGLGQLALGQMGMGQTGQMGQAGLGQGGRMAGGPGFYPNNMQPPYY